MRALTPYQDIERLYIETIKNNINVLEEKFKTSRGVNICETAINFNKYRLGVIDYFYMDGKEIITSVDYPDILPQIPNYKYNNNLQELQDYGFKKHLHKYSLFYSKPSEHAWKNDLKYNILIPSLFKNESNEWLEWYFAYYRRHGVDKFIMHYNGKLSERQNLPRYNDVEYVEWDVPKLMCRVHDISWYDLAHVQLALFPLIAKKYIPQSKYTLAIDVDELIYPPDGWVLLDYLNKQQFNQNKCGIRLRSKFTSIDFEKNTFNVKNMEPCLPKIIYSNYYRHFPYILLHHKCFNVIEDCEMQMMHVTNHQYCGPARTIEHLNRFNHLTDLNYTTYNII